MKRTLPVQEGTESADADARERVSALFGNDHWLAIYEAQRQGRVTGNESWRLYVDRFRLQLKGLGYHHVSAIEVTNTKNVVVYHLVFASNHRVGGDVFDAVVNKARSELPKLIEQEKRRRNRSAPLFDEEELDAMLDDPARYAQLLPTDPLDLESVLAGAEIPAPQPAGPPQGQQSQLQFE